MSPQAKARRGLPADTRSRGEAGTSLPHHSPQEEPALLAPGSQTSGLKNCENINVCPEAARMGDFVTAALGNEGGGEGKEKEE